MIQRHECDAGMQCGGKCYEWNMYVKRRNEDIRGIQPRPRRICTTRQFTGLETRGVGWISGELEEISSVSSRRYVHEAAGYESQPVAALYTRASLRTRTGRVAKLDQEGNSEVVVNCLEEGAVMGSVAVAVALWLQVAHGVCKMTRG